MPRCSHNASTLDRVTIGGHRVGLGEPVFVVAEAGVNHNGSLETALRMVDAAVEAGADAVKFQMFRAAELAAASAPTASYQRRGYGEASQVAMLRQLELSPGEFERISKRCAERSIIFLATPFSPADVTRLEEIGAPAIKIASTDLTNTPLLEAAEVTGLPLILSTGACTEQEVRTRIQALGSRGMLGRVILLHCVSCYPTPVEALNLRAISTLRQLSGVPCGLSDHTTSTQAGGWAVGAGACLLEKHFTLDKEAPGPDQALSLSPSQLREYVAAARSAGQALGTGRLGMTTLEEDVRTVARRSIVTTQAIAVGTPLAADHLTLKRPGTGIAPAEWSRVIGRQAAVDIPGDTVLSWDMLA